MNATKSPVERLLNLPRPLVIAHRGFSAVAPENTLAAFERGVASGADLVELDYHHSKDEELVVLHDATLDRTTDALSLWGGKALKVSDRSLEELRLLQTGLWFRPPSPQLTLPTLAEALDVIQRGSSTLIERKAGAPDGCVKLIRERGLLNQVVVQAFDWEYLRAYKRLEPSQILGALGPPSAREKRKLTDSEKTLSAGWLDEIKSIGARVAVWNSQVTRSSVRAAHRRGLSVWIYTINDEATARKLLKIGVDGIITDNPAIIWKSMAELRPPGRRF